MKVNALDVATLAPSMFSGTPHPAPAPAPATSDINWFNAVLKAPATETPYNVGAGIQSTHPLSQRSEFLQGLSDKAARALQKISTSTDPIDMLKSTRAMSAFHLETVLSAKMISKTSQAIEKLTNLS